MPKFVGIGHGVLLTFICSLDDSLYENPSNSLTKPNQREKRKDLATYREMLATTIVSASKRQRTRDSELRTSCDRYFLFKVERTPRRIVLSQYLLCS